MLAVSRAQPILPATRPWPLHDRATTRRIETRALAAVPPGTLMSRAGLSVARLALATAPAAQRIWIAAGPGGNGGDGLHAAAVLAGLGRQVRVTLLADPAQQPADAAQGLARAQAAGVSIGPALPEPGEVDLAIDALLGIGTGRAPQGAVAEAIARLNAVRGPRLSVDLPSGLDADTGQAWGAAVVQADLTLSLLTLKPGLFIGQGRQQCGAVWLDDLGVAARDEDGPLAWLSCAEQARSRLPSRRHDTHKGSFGDVFIVGGAAGMTGAARLAALAAQAAGAGRTWVSLLDEDPLRGDVTRPEWLWTAEAWRRDPRELAASTVVCGCGGGDALAEPLARLMAHAGALVLDADALNAVARDPALETLLADRAGRGQATVLTPHPLEAARLLGTHTAQVQADRLGAARALSERLHAVVVLKGSGTVTHAPSGRPIVNSTGNAALARGGSGDVLAGWIGGLWATQREAGGRPAALWDAAFQCAVSAVWLHGAAADRWPTRAARARDLVDAMVARQEEPDVARPVGDAGPR